MNRYLYNICFNLLDVQNYCLKQFTKIEIKKKKLHSCLDVLLFHLCTLRIQLEIKPNNIQMIYLFLHVLCCHLKRRIQISNRKGGN